MADLLHTQMWSEFSTSVRLNSDFIASVTALVRANKAERHRSEKGIEEASDCTSVIPGVMVGAAMKTT